MPGLFDPQLDPSVIDGDGLPLDVSDQRGPAPAAGGKTDWKRLAPLLAALPLALKRGGRVGGAALLRGYERARQQSVEEQRRTSADEETRAYRRDSLSSLQAQRDATTAGLTEQKRQQFFQQFNQAMDGLDNPADVEAQMPLWQARARSLGIADDPLAFAPTPIALSKRKAAKVLAEALKGAKDFGLDPATASVKIDGKDVPIRDLDGYVNGPKAAPEAADLSKSGLDVQLAAAMRRAAAGDPKAADEVKLLKDAILTGDTLRRDPVRINVNTNDRAVNTRIEGLRTRFDSHPIVKEFNEVQAQHQTINGLVRGAWSGPADMSIIFAFMKALDPNSVVRETEYTNASKSGNIFTGWAARFNGALSPNGGFLSPQVKADFLRAIDQRMGVKRAQYSNLRGQVSRRIDDIRAGKAETGDDVLTDYDKAFADAPDAAAGKTKTKVGRFEVEIEP